MAKKICRFCGSEKEVRRTQKKFWACAHCRTAVYAVKKSPETIEQVWPLFHDHAILPQVRRIKIPWKCEIPDELDAKRYRTQDRDENVWYLIVSEYSDKPVELFMSTAGENDHRLQSRISNLTTITRLISLMLRHVFLGEKITLEKIKNQLQKSSRKKNDLPDMVLGVLNKYETETPLVGSSK